VDPFAFYDPLYISTAYDFCDDDATKIKLTCSDKKGSIRCRVRVSKYFVTWRTSCDSKSTHRDYVSPFFSPQICRRNSYVTTNFRI